MCMCNFAWKGRPQNDLYRVMWDDKPYSLTICSFVSILPAWPGTAEPNQLICWFGPFWPSHFSGPSHLHIWGVIAETLAVFTFSYIYVDR